MGHAQGHTTMIRYTLSSQESNEFTCDHCQNQIPESEVVLMRESCALPEEPTYHVHERCADRFPEKRTGKWKQITRQSMDAGWLI